MAARTNGDVKFGSFMTFLGGIMVANGISTLSDHMWYGIGLILIGIISDVSGIAKVESGIKELVRVHDLEKSRNGR